MHVEFYERIWMWAAGALIVVFLAVIVVTAGLHATAPPSHIETVDPAALDSHPEFGAPAVTETPDGRLKAVSWRRASSTIRTRSKCRRGAR